MCQRHTGFAVTLMVVVLASMSCSPGTGPVMVIGVDGLDWGVVLPLIRDGRMPTLEGLMKRGSFGTLSTQTPAKSPVVWTTVATGKKPSGHGILDFSRVATNGERVLYSSTDRTTKALWNILTDSGQSTAVVGWWTTYPVEPIAGVMVAPYNTLEQTHFRQRAGDGVVARQVYPEALADVVGGIVDQIDGELPSILTTLFPAAAANDRPEDAATWDACLRALRADESVRRVTLELTRHHPVPDVVLSYFGITDIVGHRFWRYHEPEAFRHPPAADRVRQLGDAIDRAYGHVDAVLGEVIAAMPSNTTVIVMSDHGMRAKHVDAERWVEADGRSERESGGHGSGTSALIVAAGPPIRRAAPDRPLRQLTPADLPSIGDVSDITPTILALRGVPIGEDMDGVVLDELLRPGFFGGRAPASVPSHDTPEWLASRNEGEAVDLPGHEERLEQLRILGYLDEDHDAANSQ